MSYQPREVIVHVHVPDHAPCPICQGTGAPYGHVRVRLTDGREVCACCEGMGVPVVRVEVRSTVGPPVEALEQQLDKPS